MTCLIRYIKKRPALKVEGDGGVGGVARYLWFHVLERRRVWRSLGFAVHWNHMGNLKILFPGSPPEILIELVRDGSGH